MCSYFSQLMLTNPYIPDTMPVPHLTNLPLEVLYHILQLCSIPDVISVAMALARPQITDIFLQKRLWTRSVIGPRMLNKSLHFLGEHVEQLLVLGMLKFDKNLKPKKEKFFKSGELLPTYVLSYLRTNCNKIKISAAQYNFCQEVFIFTDIWT